MSAVAEERAGTRLSTARSPGAPVLAVLVLVVAGLVLLVQALHLRGLLDVTSPLTAGFAKALVLFYGVAVAALTAAAAFLPVRRLAVPVVAAAGLATLTLLATLTVGGEAWSFLAAALVMCACWLAGRLLLTALRVPALAAQAPVAWLAGSAVLGLVLLFCGRAGMLRWWTLGAPVLALGAAGAVMLARAAAAGPATAAWQRIRSDRLSAGCASVGLLLLGLACVWTASPDLMYDAVYGKAWLPAEWARTGAIEPLRAHPVLNAAGFAQLLALPGHLVGAEGIGQLHAVDIRRRRRRDRVVGDAQLGLGAALCDRRRDHAAAVLADQHRVRRRAADAGGARPRGGGHGHVAAIGGRAVPRGARAGPARRRVRGLQLHLAVLSLRADAGLAVHARHRSPARARRLALGGMAAAAGLRAALDRRRQPRAAGLQQHLQELVLASGQRDAELPVLPGRRPSSRSSSSRSPSRVCSTRRRLSGRSGSSSSRSWS